MNRAALRSLLGRQMKDVQNQDFTPAELNDALNEGAIGALKLQLSMQPDSVRAISKSDITANNEFYEKPSNAWSLYAVQLLQSDGTYKTIEKRDYGVAKDRTDSTETVWAHFGRYIALLPIPTTSLANGIRWLYVPSGAMSADTDIPVLHAGLHRLIFLEAALALLPETGQPTKEIRDAIAREWNQAAAWLRLDTAENEQLRPEIDKGY